MNSSIPSLIVNRGLRDDVVAVLARLVPHSIDTKDRSLQVLTGRSWSSVGVLEVMVEHSAVGVYEWQVRVLAEDVANIVMSLCQVWMEVVGRVEKVRMAGLGVEEDLIRARGTQAGHDQAVFLLRSQSVLSGEAVLDSRGIDLHVAWADVVGDVGVGRDLACVCQGVSSTVDRSTVMSGTSAEEPSDVTPDRLCLLWGWTSVVVDDAAVSGDSAVVGMSVARLVLDLHSHVVILGVGEEVLGDIVGMNLELVLRQPGASVRWVDHQRSVPPFTMLSWLRCNRVPGVLMSVVLEMLVHSLALCGGHGGGIDMRASVCLDVKGMVSCILVALGVVRPSILAVLNSLEADVHMTRSVLHMDNIRMRTPTQISSDVASVFIQLLGRHAGASPGVGVGWHVSADYGLPGLDHGMPDWVSVGIEIESGWVYRWGSVGMGRRVMVVRDRRSSDENLGNGSDEEEEERMEDHHVE